jgi:signal transduction histidine kinase
LYQCISKADRVIIEVKDSGCGIDKSINGRVFERGYSTKSAAGLGLYSCRAIAESHEATVDVTSKGIGKGTIATIEFKI